MCDEMIKLRSILDERGVKWADKSDKGMYPIDRTHFYWKGYFVSVINGFGTYGGFSSFNPINNGLLEVMIGESEPIGCLTADEVIQKIDEVFGNV